MNHFPVFLNLQGRPVLVVGSGQTAVQRAELMLRFGGAVFVATDGPCGELAALIDVGRVTQVAVDPVHWTSTPWVLVFALSPDPQMNRIAHEFATARSIPVNVMDDAAHCTFIMPALIERPPLLIAVSTGGEAPALARAIREWLEILIGPAYGRLAALAGSMRRTAKERIPDFSRRRYFWEHAFRGRALDLALTGQEEDARQRLEDELDAAVSGHSQGEAVLVGAGPGDPELLTLRALRALQRADVIIHDHLVSEDVLAMARPGAERVYVGKMAGRHACSQDRIHELMLERVRRGQTVIRLKGGDPFIFGRGGEEVQAMAEAGVAVSVVPAVSAANGCAAYAGIPLTHRDCAHSVTFVTAHLREGALSLDWPQLAKPLQTVVFFMGLSSLGIIGAQLQAHGLPADYPAAIVSEGTTPRQRVWRCTLGSLTHVAQAHDIASPALLIVGQVVNLARERTDVQPAALDTGAPPGGNRIETVRYA